MHIAVNVLSLYRPAVHCAAELVPPDSTGCSADSRVASPDLTRQVALPARQFNRFYLDRNIRSLSIEMLRA
jgi:hypothetical protein